MLRTRNNTDGDKLVMFSGIASYYGDNYIILNKARSPLARKICVHNSVAVSFVHTAIQSRVKQLSIYF